MPCSSSHMDSTLLEQELSRVFAFLDEVNYKITEHSENFGSGYDDRVYGKATQRLLDYKTSLLCATITNTSRPLSKFSLELQLWWRDHQRLDAARAKTKELALSNKSLRESGLAKLLPEEREALSLPQKDDPQ